MPADPPTADDDLLTTAFWEPHASPRSVWPLIAAYPLLLLAVYRRDPRLLGGTLLGVVANLLLVSPPETDEAWATRVVLGERVWLDRDLRSEPGTLGLLAVGGAVHLATMRAALRQDRLRTLVGGAVSMVLMGVFFDRMVRLYEQENERQAVGAETGVED
jgi:hypothetical protein